MLISQVVPLYRLVQVITGGFGCGCPPGATAARSVVRTAAAIAKCRVRTMIASARLAPPMAPPMAPHGQCPESLGSQRVPARPNAFRHAMAKPGPTVSRGTVREAMVGSSPAMTVTEHAGRETATHELAAPATDRPRLARPDCPVAANRGL